MNRAKFIKSRMKQYMDIPDEELESVINLHINYRTYIEVVDSNKLIAAIRFNISNTGKIAYILDLIIEPGYDSRWIMRKMIEEGVRRFPNAQYLHFSRSKRPDDKPEVVKIDRFLQKIKGD